MEMWVDPNKTSKSHIQNIEVVISFVQGDMAMQDRTWSQKIFSGKNVGNLKALYNTMILLFPSPKILNLGKQCSQEKWERKSKRKDSLGQDYPLKKGGGGKSNKSTPIDIQNEKVIKN